MLKTEKKVEEDALKTALESGYKNAAASLSVMIKDRVSFHISHHSQHPVGKNIIENGTLINLRDSNTFITTEIFGDACGKSYLLLTPEEIDVLAQRSFSGKNQPSEVKIEFIKELDNILSAAVISKLSDHLGLKMYGDVPNWVGKIEGSITDLINQDFNKGTVEVCVSSVSFSIDSYPSFQPVFLWIIDSKVVQSLSIKITP